MREGDEWQRIADSGRVAAGDFDRQVGLLLADPGPGFAGWFAERTRELAVAQLWDAASLLQGWLSAAGFAAVRAWVVSKGDGVFAAVRDDPDSLADQYPLRAELDRPELLRLRALAAPAGADELPGEWTNISDDRAVRARFPRLYGIVDARRCR